MTRKKTKAREKKSKERGGKPQELQASLRAHKMAQDTPAWMVREGQNP